MRHTLLLQSLLLALGTTVAQDTPERTEYLFGGNMRVSGAGGLLTQFGSIDLNSNISTGTGAGGGLIFDRRLLVGAYGMGLTSQVERSFAYNDQSWPARFNFGHGGLWLQYSLMARKPMHPFVGLQVGWGSAEWDFDDDEGDGSGNQSNLGPSDMNDQVLVITPTAGMQLNITRWFRPDLFVGYRLVDGLDLEGTSSTDLDGLLFGIDLMFGGLGD